MGLQARSHLSAASATPCGRAEPFCEGLCRPITGDRRRTNEPVRVASAQVRLELGEAGPPPMDDDHLPVDDRLTRDVEGAGNDRETIDQLWPLRVKGLPVVVVDVELDAVTVVFDFVNHCAPEGAFTFRVASWRLI